MYWFYFKLIIRRSINSLGFLGYFLPDSLLFLIRPKTASGNVAVIKLGAIGDYFLFRNFLPTLNETYGKLTLILSEDVAPICNSYDREFIDQIIIVNPSKMETSLFYRLKVLSGIRKVSFSTIIQASFSRRALVEDALVRLSKSDTKITPQDDGNHIASYLIHLTNFFYTRVIPVKTSSPFEYLKNHSYIEQIIGPFKIPTFELKLEKKDPKIITIFPGAGRPYRKWAPEKFAEIVNWITKTLKLKIYILGTKSDFEAGEIIRGNNKNVINYCGKIKLIESIELVAKSKVLIGNESGPAHIGASLGVPTIAISNGNHFGRFHPYPKEINNTIYFIYPPEIKNEITRNNTESLIKKYRLRSVANINNVETDQVITLLKEIF